MDSIPAVPEVGKWVEVGHSAKTAGAFRAGVTGKGKVHGMSAYLLDETEKHSKTWSIVGAILMIIAGVLAICLPVASSIGVVIILSWLLIIAGIAHVIAAFRFKSFGNVLWELILAAVAVFVGLYMRAHPVMGLATLTLVMAFYFLATGCSELALYFRNRSLPNSGWVLFHAIINFLLFVLIWIHWPANSLWLIGMFVGIDLLFGGIARLAGGAPFSRWQATRPA
jgi:uncharacterized membrane protein HdeD (DUF308 family)